MDEAPDIRADKRVVRSRRLIIEAFERLLLRMPLEQITASAIAREAEVDRKTFYRNFGSIEGLLDSIAQNMVQTTLDGVRWSAGTNGQVSETELRTFFLSTSRIICRNLSVNRRYFECIPQEQLFAHLKEPFLRGIQERELLARAIPEERLACVLSFYLGGLLTLCRAWLLDESDLTLEEISQIASDLILRGLEGYVRRLPE